MNGYPLSYKQEHLKIDTDVLAKRKTIEYHNAVARGVSDTKQKQLLSEQRLATKGKRVAAIDVDATSRVFGGGLKMPGFPLRNVATSSSYCSEARNLPVTAMERHNGPSGMRNEGGTFDATCRNTDPSPYLQRQPTSRSTESNSFRLHSSYLGRGAPVGNHLIGSIPILQRDRGGSGRWTRPATLATPARATMSRNCTVDQSLQTRSYTNPTSVKANAPEKGPKAG